MALTIAGLMENRLMKIFFSFKSVRLMFLIAFLAIPSIWLSVFTIKKSVDGGDVFFESIYLVCIIISYFLIRKLSIQILEIGWLIFACGLLIDLLDEFTKEPDLFNTYIQGFLTSLGLVLVAVGFYLSYRKLQDALNEVKTLSGLLPICSHCRNIRDDKGYWDRIETYLQKHSDAKFTHGICPECAKKYYPDFKIYDD